MFFWVNEYLHLFKQLCQIQQDLARQQTENDKDTIKHLRDSQSTLIDDAEDDVQSSTYDDVVIDNEKYLQNMAIDRNWEIPRNKLVTTDEKLGRGEFGTVRKGIYVRTDGKELPVAIKILKGL